MLAFRSTRVFPGLINATDTIGLMNDQAFYPVAMVILISWPIAQMKPASSRAMAAATTVGFLPLAIMERYRPHSLVCALQAISRMFLGSRTRISAFALAMRAGYW